MNKWAQRRYEEPPLKSKVCPICKIHTREDLIAHIWLKHREFVRVLEEPSITAHELKIEATKLGYCQTHRPILLNVIPGTLHEVTEAIY